MRVVIAGGTGLIGTRLVADLRARGDEPLVLTRRSAADEHLVQWDPRRGTVDRRRLDGVDAVINLAGAPIADRPWTRARRTELWDSRVQTTAALLSILGELDRPPSVYVGAGGLGRFGDRGEDYLRDDASPGEGFLAELSVAWEAAHLEAREALGCRAAVIRMGIVLSAEGGALPLMLKPFKLGLGGWLGHGRQYVSWISRRDATAAFLHVVDDERCEGGINGTVPEPIRNKEWCKALGRALSRPVLTHAPRWVLKGALGEFADSLFLASVRAVPEALLRTGFEFRDPDAEETFTRLVAVAQDLRRNPTS